MTENTMVEAPKQRVGRKTIADKKKPITIYRPSSEIQKMGGPVEARVLINKFINELLSK